MEQTLPQFLNYIKREDIAEVFGQETAYKNTLREFKERFPEVYTSVQKTK